MAADTESFQARWVRPVAWLTAAALTVFWSSYALDYFVTGGSHGSAFHQGVLSRYLDFDPSSITDAVSALAAMVAAVLGIVITVVSIIVQLSSDRYTGVASMFLRDRLNIGVMGFYIIGTVVGVLLSVSLKGDYVPRATLTVMLSITTFGIVLMAPYFGYVFWFVEPRNIITRIRRDAVRTAREGAALTDPALLLEAQAATLSAMEELTDITSNSISGKDKIIASGAVDALKDFALAYIRVKGSSTERWFEIGELIKTNPDFVAMDPESLGDLVTRRTWVEWKVMRQYLGIYNEALAQMRDINYLVAIDTRYIGEAAGQANDEELMHLVFRFMNSYLRATLNARDVRTAYNVLNQYRLLVEAMVRQGHGQMALEGVKHMIYYGHVSFDSKLTFVTETVAYDVGAVCQCAHEAGAPEEAGMLDAFLQLDRPLRARSQEAALLGVRKAQVKLAAFYLTEGQEQQARLISEDMADEPADRLAAIRESLESVTTKDFWEIIDRGRNFEYMPPAQRASLSTFFSWLEVPSSPGES